MTALAGGVRPSPGRRGVAAGGLLGVVVGAVALALALADVDGALLAAAFVRAGVSTLLLATAAHVGVQAVYALRWRVFLAEAPPPYSPTFGIVGAGYLANYTLPARPGELIRAGLARAVLGVPIAAGLASLVLEKLLDGVTILLSAGLVGLLVPTPDWLRAAIVTGGATFAIGGVLIGAVGLVSARGWRAAAAGSGWAAHRLRWIGARLDDAGAPVRRLARPRRIALVLALSLASWGAIVLHQAAVATGVGLPPRPLAWLALYGALGLASVVPGVPGYVGTYQLAAVGALAIFGVERESAIAIATLYQVSRLLGSLLVGGWLVARLGPTAIVAAARSAGRAAPRPDSS